MKTYCIVWTVVMAALAVAMATQNLIGAAVYAALIIPGAAALYWPKSQRMFILVVSVLITVSDIANVAITRTVNLPILLGLAVAALGFWLVWRARRQVAPPTSPVESKKRYFGLNCFGYA